MTALERRGGTEIKEHFKEVLFEGKKYRHIIKKLIKFFKIEGGGSGVTPNWRARGWGKEGKEIKL